MVAGVFVYPHLFSTQKTNVSDLLTSDSPTRFLNRLVSVLVAVATLPLWEGLFRHTDLQPSPEEIVSLTSISISLTSSNVNLFL